MRYKIENIEHKEYEGRKYAKANVVALDGTELEVSFGDKWGEKLATLAEGQDVEANAWQNPKNSKWSLYPIEDRKPPARQNYASRRDISKDVEKAQLRTEKGIEKTLDRKEEAIKLTAAQRDSVLIITAMMAHDTEPWREEFIKEQIVKWRNWFLLSSEFNEIPPFE